MEKSELRRTIREKKRAMTETQINEASAKLTELFCNCEAYRNAKALYGYVPYNQEVRVLSILEQAIKDGKRVAVPKVFGDTMRFIWITDLTAMEKGYAGIPEPVADGPVADDPEALVLMPGLAFTKNGDRMGYGGGFYDRFLAQERTHPTVALCYDFQMVDALPTEQTDIPVDLVLWA